jgi:hypothetical protein
MPHLHSDEERQRQKMITKYLKQTAYTPTEVQRLRAAYDRIISVIGQDSPLGLKEATAAEIMAQASRLQRVDETDIVRRVRSRLNI